MQQCLSKLDTVVASWTEGQSLDELETRVTKVCRRLAAELVSDSSPDPDDVARLFDLSCWLCRRLGKATCAGGSDRQAQCPLGTDGVLLI
jgi:hypothetical protein